MRKWTKATGLIFLAAASVYSGQVVGAAPGKSGKAGTAASNRAPTAADANKNTDVKLLDDQFDPFANAASPSTQPSTAEPAAAAGAATTADPSATSPNTAGSSTASGSFAATPVSSPSGGSAAATPAMATNPDGTFSLNITSGADLGETLRVIGFQAQKSVLPSKDVHATLPALDLYNVTVPEALQAILKINGFVYKEEGNFIYVYTAKEAAEMEKANRVQNTEVFRVYYTPAANAATMIKPVLSADGQVALTTAATSGLDSGTKDVGGNNHATEDMLVVTDYPENIDRVRKVLKDIDRRPQQILIEATILRAALSDDNALGVDFNVVGGVDFSSITPAAVNNGQITGANVTGGPRDFGNPVSTVGTGNSFTSNIPGGLKVGFISNNVSVFVSALEGVTDTAVLANPKVLALNKHKGEVIVGRRDGYLTTTVTESSTVQTVDFLDTGTRLIFRPFIGDDGYIRMEVHPEDSSGGLTSSNLPFKITSEVTSNIMIKDGHTVVIGGLFREASDSSRSQTPLLGNIPVAGVLFRQTRDRSQREEIIILLTPHIIKDDAAFSDAAEEMLKAADQMRVGVRKGMMWWGRERLAETAYEQAVAEMNKPNPNRSKALWHLDCATNLNPRFLEAIQMKQELTGKTLTTVDNSAIRGFVRRQIMNDRAMHPATMPSSDAEGVDLESGADGPATTQPSDADASKRGFAEVSLTATPAAQTKGMVGVNGDEFSLSGATPTTQPSAAVARKDFNSFDFGSLLSDTTELVMAGSSSSASPATQPATQPSDSNPAFETTVTELPSEEVTGGNK